MTTPDGLTRDAAWLRMLAAHIRNGTLMTWDIPNTLASTIDGISDRLIERGVEAIAVKTTLEAYRASVNRLPDAPDVIDAAVVQQADDDSAWESAVAAPAMKKLPLMRLRYRQAGGHIHCRLFKNGNSGTLVFRLDEWPAVMETLNQVIDVLPEEDAP